MTQQNGGYGPGMATAHGGGGALGVRQTNALEDGCHCIFRLCSA